VLSVATRSPKPGPVTVAAMDMSVPPPIGPEAGVTLVAVGGET
jgi:hypothetical protein